MKAKYIIFFDDTCRLCWRSVNRILSWDKKKVFNFIPIRDETAKLVLKKQYKKLKNANTLILVENYATKKSKVWIRGRAVMRIFWILGGCKKLIGWLCFVPWGLDFIYTLIATRRHRF